MDPAELQELALKVARLPRPLRTQFLISVLSNADLGDAALDSSSSGEREDGRESAERNARQQIPPHPEPVILQARERLERARSLVQGSAWGRQDLALLAGCVFAEGEEDPRSVFTTTILNEVIAGEAPPDQRVSLNVQTLYGLERKFLLTRIPHTRPNQFQFTKRGYGKAREVAERSLAADG